VAFLASLLLVTLSSAAPAPRAVVLLAPENRALVLGPVVSAVQSQLSDLAVELRVEPVQKLEGSLAARMSAAGTVQGALAVIWLDLNPGEPIFVYVADPRSHRIFARNVDWDPAGGHFAASGLVVRSAVQALLAGRSIGFEAPAGDTARAAGPDPFVRGEPERGFSMAVRVGYALGLLAQDARALHGAELALQVGYGPHLFAAAQYRLYPSFLRRLSQYSEALLSRHPISLAAGGRLELGPLEVGLELTATLDAVAIEVHVLGPWQLAAPEPQTDLRWLLGPTAWATMRVVGGLSVVAGIGLDMPLGARDYLVTGADDKPATLLKLYSAQPRASIGLQWEAL
jgi:hypothetical protein